MIKAVIFDMDGVLIDAKDWHYDALNRALGSFGYEINRHEHLTTYDGLPTRKKLEMLSVKHGLPRESHGHINHMKQLYTLEIIEEKCKPLFIHEYALSTLKSLGYRLAVASNSIRPTVEIMMQKSGLMGYLDVVLAATDVAKPKPDPEIYQTTINRLALNPTECLIIEDNEHGIKAAIASGAHVLTVTDILDVNFDNIMSRISAIDNEVVCA